MKKQAEETWREKDKQCFWQMQGTWSSITRGTRRPTRKVSSSSCSVALRSWQRMPIKDSINPQSTLISCSYFRKRGQRDTVPELNESLPTLNMKPRSQASFTLANSSPITCHLLLSIVIPCPFPPLLYPLPFSSSKNANLAGVWVRTSGGSKWHARISIIQGRFNKATNYKVTAKLQEMRQCLGTMAGKCYSPQAPWDEKRKSYHKQEIEFLRRASALERSSGI